MSAADFIVTNARVITMDPDRPRADAVAVAGNRIIAVGDHDSVMDLRGPGTRVFDAEGGSVTPGFVESHLHVFTGGVELDQCHLSGVTGAEALRDTVLTYAEARPDEPLLIGQGALYTILSEEAVITRQDLDAVIADRPFVMFSPDHHTAWANTAALEKAGLLQGRAVGVGSEVVMGPDGLANGELRESPAFSPVLALSTTGGRERLGLATGRDPDPAPSAADRARDQAVMKRSLDYLARNGITSFHNMDGNPYTLELIDAVNRDGGFAVRGRVPFHFVKEMEPAALEIALQMRARYDDDRLRSGYVKFFMDGVIESRTAVMADDYADQPGWRGEPLFEAERFAALATEIDRLGFQIAVHAIGDGAVKMVLDGYEAAARANGRRDSRHRIEHIEVIRPQDIARLADLGVLGSVQPPHPPGSFFPLEPTMTRIGEAKWPYSYAWNSLRDAGVRLVFASDWPVAPIDPLFGIQCAMTRKAYAPGLADHRQTLDQAIAGYTIDGAYAEFTEDRKGRLKPGYYADLVVLSGDLERAEPESIGRIEPVLTLCDGVVTYEA
ncbi:amidohydrolase [Segnochrobactrum spirostomi]|uniref:Amidohydrolase n=1 Tax=Segnochrobactrum spirostomi TaxID=2608987 RepID=A0A6A7Y282_9HYPH|nr:amidohydrolase [Segnochrobactrum spirostomi]MQT13133.1 amidohydrolase [Segnochrobactrum spirostomi]